MSKQDKVPCPYNDKHMMRYTRLIYHLAKGCPDMGNSDYEICIYNWVHRVPKGTLEEHYEMCENKPKIVGDNFNQDVNMEVWKSCEWHPFLYLPSWPPDFFPDY